MDNTLINNETDLKMPLKSCRSNEANLLLAKAVYLSSDGNLSKAVKTLKDRFHLKISIPAFSEWVKKHGWDRNLKSHQFAKFVGTEDLFCELYHVKNEALEVFRNKKSAHAATAVTGIYNSLIDAYSKTKKAKVESFEGVMKIFAEWLMAKKPDVAPAFESVFEEFFLYMTETYSINRQR
ncbi:MAG: hypothetical protein H7844_00445 [Nitrospirae bacterium YQR-1]